MLSYLNARERRPIKPVSDPALLCGPERRAGAVTPAENVQAGSSSGRPSDKKPMGSKRKPMTTVRTNDKFAIAFGMSPRPSPPPRRLNG
jgi:hypothetical protein